MNHEQQARRPSTTAQTVPIPRAPPLPAPRPLQRARDAASRFLGYPSRPPSPQDDMMNDRFAPRTGRADRYAPLAMTQNATATHKTGLEISAIAINEKGTHALIGGKDIFKTVKIEDGRCAEDLNLRAIIRKTPTNASGQPRNNFSIDIADVAWAKGDWGEYVAAATSSGKIMLYNLGHVTLKHIQLHEHFRQVHKVTFNPHKGNLLLSGSQDGTVRLWDLRDARQATGTIQSKRKFSGLSDGVRDVKWSPTEGLDFAFGTDNGEVQRWDMRNLKAAKVRIPAHILACNTIDWHPDGEHIVSASSDKTVRVFDLSGGRQKKASWEIKTPYPVMNARWRPSCESSMYRDHGARQCTQVVTSYDRDHAVMHIWDFRRPYLPFRMLEPFYSAPTDLLWHSQDLLWTVGREGILLQTDVHHAPKVMDQRNLQTIAVSTLNELTYVAQSRKQRRIPKPQPLPTTLLKKSSSLGTSPDSNFLSRSWADDGLDHSFLSVEPGKHHERSGSSSRGATTSAPGQARTLKLDDVLLNRVSFRPHQHACRGDVLSHNNPDLVAYIGRECITGNPQDCSDVVLIKRLQRAFETNARVAETVGHFSLCQTWKIASHWTIKHLQKKFELKAQRDAAKRASQEGRTHTTALEMLASRLATQHVTSQTTSPASMRPLSTIHQQLALPESTSNVPTPLARPTTSRKPPMINLPLLPDIDKEETIALPPSLATKVIDIESSPKASVRPKASRSITDNRLTADNLFDLNSLQSTDRDDMVRRWSTQPRVPLNLDPANMANMKVPPRLEKHDSAESFRFLEGSTDSRTSSFPASLGSSGSANGELVSAHPSRAAKNSQPKAETVEHTEDDDQALLFDGSGTLGSGSSKQQAQNGKALLQQTLGIAVDKVESQSHKVEEIPRHAVEFEENPEVLRRRSAMPEASGHPHGQEQDQVSHLHQKMAPSIISTQAISAMALNEHPIRPDHPPEEPIIDLEEGNPFTLLELLQGLLHQTTVIQPNPQIAAIFLLLLGPILPPTHPLEPTSTHQTISNYVEYFLNHLSWNPDEIPSLVQDSFSQPIKAGLQPLQLEAILSTYHDQLLSHRLYAAATHLRRLAYPAFPAVYEDFLKDNSVGLKCGHCGRPLPLASSPSNDNNGNSKGGIGRGGVKPLQCPTCHRKPKNCPICWLPHSPFGDSHQFSVTNNNNDNNTTNPDSLPLTPSSPFPTRGPNPSTLFTSCLLCGHSAHAACLDDWFLGAAAGTGCPTEGCLCDCVPGAWRDEKRILVDGIAKKRTAATTTTRAHGAGAGAAAGRGGGEVRSDEWKAGESEAVEFARVALIRERERGKGR